MVERLQRKKLDGILICDPRHVYYLTGFLTASYHASLVFLTASGSSHLVLPVAAEPGRFVATKVTVYNSQRLGTLINDQFGAAMRLIESELGNLRDIAIDAPQLALPRHKSVRDMSGEMLELRRKKEKDEVELISHAVRACEAGYARAAEIMQPGIREIDVYAEVQAAAVKELGEPIGELGNDFQSGTPGGPPRVRPVEHRELMPLDVGVSVRRYRCDLCRTFAIGNEPTAKQQAASRLVHQALQYAEERVRPGVSCRHLYEEINKLLGGVNGWQFFHHLGHGIGLSHHEGPHLNPHWDDQFEIGDVFTLEPGLYHDELRGGIRIEHNYWLSPDGLVRLSSHPTEL